MVRPAAHAHLPETGEQGKTTSQSNGGRILTLPPECLSPTRQALRMAKKHAGSEIGAPQRPTSRGQCQDAPVMGQ